jgi:hypothetical protein
MQSVMKNKFQLSGIGDASLENTVYEAVERAGYSMQELSDIREPIHYSLLDLKYDLNNIKHNVLQLEQIATLTPDIVVPCSIINIKTLLKRVFAKIFRWYVVPMAASQSCFNHETVTLISEIMSLLETQKQTIERLQKELTEVKKNV